MLGWHSCQICYPLEIKLLLLLLLLLQLLERVQNYACKRFMNVSQKACNAMVLGDSNQFLLYTWRPPNGQ